MEETTKPESTLAGHSRPLKPLLPRARANLQARGQKWPSCQPCSAKGRAAEPSEEPVGHLPCNAVCLFRCFPSCSRPLIPPRLCSCTAPESGPSTDVARHRSLSVPSSLAGRDRPLYLLSTPDRGLEFGARLSPGLVLTANTGQVSPLPRRAQSHSVPSSRSSKHGW